MGDSRPVAFVDVHCPYCDFKNRFSVHGFYPLPRVVVCDIDDGGCDRRFVLESKVVVSAAALKIEGEVKR